MILKVVAFVVPAVVNAVPGVGADAFVPLTNAFLKLHIVFAVLFV